MEHYYVNIGSYKLKIPSKYKTDISLTNRDLNINEQILYTYWKIRIDKFYLSINLSSFHKLDGLKNNIKLITKEDVDVDVDVDVNTITVNDISGVTYGNYEEPRTWIDWWFRKGDTTICINLQSEKFPHTKPTKDDILLHQTIINSLQYLG